jgi:hypothetical protein
MSPMVGNREFSYDAEGRKAAKKEAAKTGQPMMSHYKNPKAAKPKSPLSRKEQKRLLAPPKGMKKK